MGNSPDSKPIKGREFSTYRYIGELNSQGVPNGKGLILHNSGEAFYGFFSNGKKYGIGIYIDKDLTKYICNWVNDKVDRELKVKPLHAEKVFSFFYSNGVIKSCRVYRVGPKLGRSLDAEPKGGTPRWGELHSPDIDNEPDRADVYTIEGGDKGCASILPVSKPSYVLPFGRIQQGTAASRQSGHREDAIESSRMGQLQISMEDSHDEANIPVNELTKKRSDKQLKEGGTWKDIFCTSSDSCSHFIRPHFVKLGKKKKCYRDTHQSGTTRKDLTIITHTSTKKDERKTKHMIKRLSKENSSSLKIDQYESWSRKEVAQWLSLCNAPIKWITAFYRNNVTGDRLDRINIEIIRNQLGILPYGHAIKLLQLIKNLRSHQTHQSKHKLTLGEPPTSSAPPEKEAEAVFTKKMLHNGNAINQEKDPNSCTSTTSTTSTTSFNSPRTLKEEAYGKREELGEEDAEEEHHHQQQKRHHVGETSAPNEPPEPQTPNDTQKDTNKKRRKDKKKQKEQFIRSFHKNFSLINDFGDTFNGGSSRAYSGAEGKNLAVSDAPKEVPYGSCSLSSFSVTSPSAQSSHPDFSSEGSIETDACHVSTCEGESKGGDNWIIASSRKLEFSYTSTSSSSASTSLDTSPHASTSSVSSSSYCSNKMDDAPFYGRSQIIKYPSNIYLNNNLAFSYLYSFIIPHEDLTFLHLIRNHYEVRSGRCKNVRQGQGQMQGQNLLATNSNPNKLKSMKGDLKNGKTMQSRTFRGKYLGKDVAIKVLVGRVKDFFQIHKIFYKLHLFGHGNIALMMGVSIRYPFVFIIYEFLKNGCLFSYLHCAGGYVKDVSVRQHGGGVIAAQANASSISRGGGISAQSPADNSSTCDSSPGYTYPSENPTFESYSGRITTRMRNKYNSFKSENDLFCGVFAQANGGPTSGRSRSIAANNLNSSVKSPSKERNINQSKTKAHIEEINKKNGNKKKKLHTKLFLQDQIGLHEPYAFPPFEKELCLYIKRQKKKKKKKILFSYPQAKLHFNLPQSALKADRRLSIQRILKITTDVTLACSYLEKHLSHHLNLKPTNILLDEALNAKITDFGICEIEKCLDTNVDHSYVVHPNGVTTFDAVLADRKVQRMEFSRNDLSDVLRVYDDEDQLHLYSIERIVASPSSAYPSVSFWTPPEILRGQRGRPFYTDVYALGIVLWEMLTHSVPFNYPFKSHLVASVGYAKEELTYDNIPEPIQGLIKSCVHRNMYRRPTFGHILAELSRLYEKANTKAEDALMSFMDGA
ncbi:serine/threonine protein kinase [Plasmodium inui San Antonio 1]|uniref:Serine/threonine protein kinase n=1 Tax=Plasmodium inui San Antonio 1 TaxID=1237626 RepID=W7A2H8_9APIC|nr:serine/threonine protein kinase [Plasmodium inui San Antonio 1]EUD65533.1 serine/threonine protein kinase [Plasmodium inui San Antonio 1]